MLGGGSASTLERSQTPSTTASEISSDENQWIRRPPLPQIYDSDLASDPLLLHSKLSPKELGILQDYVDLWQKNVSQLLDRLKDTIPGDGMIGEIHYWRDLARILEAANNEVKQGYVEITIQVLGCCDKKADELILRSVEAFMKQKSRVIQGTKEAKWNHKYMKVIEKPVSQIESATQFKDMQFIIVSLMKSLKSIYDNSNFYKEARIVSFIDRLLDCILGKVKNAMTISRSVLRGKSDFEVYDQEL